MNEKACDALPKSCDTVYVGNCDQIATGAGGCQIKGDCYRMQCSATCNANPGCEWNPNVNECLPANSCCAGWFNIYQDYATSSAFTGGCSLINVEDTNAYYSEVQAVTNFGDPIKNFTFQAGGTPSDAWNSEDCYMSGFAMTVFNNSNFFDGYIFDTNGDCEDSYYLNSGDIVTIEVDTKNWYNVTSDTYLGGYRVIVNGVQQCADSGIYLFDTSDNVKNPSIGLYTDLYCDFNSRNPNLGARVLTFTQLC